MATQVQFRRGTTAQNASFTGALGEVTVDTDKDTLVVHDGGTAGGFEISRADASNLKFPDGAVGTPAISFASDTNTGIYRGGTDILKFVTAGTDAITIDASQAVTLSNYIQIPDYIYHVGDGNTYFGFPGGDQFELFTAGQSRIKLVGSETVFNEGSVDKDFRVESNGGSHALFLRGSDGNVGIGTSSPPDQLSLVNVSDSNQFIGFDWADASTARIRSTRLGAGNNQNLRLDAQDNIIIATNGTERMRIRSTGKIGLGTSTADAELHIEPVSGGSNASILLSNDGRTQYFRIQNNETDDSLVFNANDSSERMRIDSSGNLLVGTTSTTPAVSNDSDGIALQSNGTVQFSASATTTAIINRKSTDGTILQFRKDGTIVGSIGTNSQHSKIAMFDSSGGFILGTTGLLPSTSAGAYNGGQRDLGTESVNWKDLYLSGGIQFDTRSNKLDDYEEGVFEPSFGGATSDPTVTYDNPNETSGIYRKIGSMVFFSLSIRTDSVTGGSGRLLIKGLPFTCATGLGESASCSVYVGYSASFGTNPTAGNLEANTTQIGLRYRATHNANTGNSDVTHLNNSADSNYIYIAGSYAAA